MNSASNPQVGHSGGMASSSDLQVCTLGVVGTVTPDLEGFKPPRKSQRRLPEPGIPSDASTIRMAAAADLFPTAVQTSFILISAFATRLRLIHHVDESGLPGEFGTSKAGKTLRSMVVDAEGGGLSGIIAPCSRCATTVSDVALICGTPTRRAENAVHALKAAINFLHVRQPSRRHPSTGTCHAVDSRPT